MLRATVLAALVLATTTARGDEERAVAALEKTGAVAIVQRDESLPGKPVLIVHIGNEVRRADLKHLSFLTRLEELAILSRRLTDADVKELAGLKQLRLLRLNAPRLTDTGLKSLAGLKELRTLD